MNTAIENYFNRIFVVNLKRRPDRLAHALEQFNRFGITNFEVFEGYENITCGGVLNGIPQGIIHGNAGCTAAHRALLEIIAYNKWPRVLVLEDDFQIVHGDFHERFNQMVSEVPPNWDLLYLGGHYSAPPYARYSPHVIVANGMSTTSSYGITWQFARKIAPYIFGLGPIDCLLSAWHPNHCCCIFSPRLMVQYGNFSDIQLRDMDNSACMQDTRHEEMV